ncbi:MAG: hypothetical protein JST66_10240 [Bacteroidetes bacterium]|nr:hypothetical protein [Bacteroidota bacterium]
MRALSALLLWPVAFLTSAQPDVRPSSPPFAYPVLPPHVATDSAAAPEGWHVMRIARGDLDRDGRVDFAIALQFRDTVPHLRPDSDLSNTPPRILAVYRRTSAGPYALVTQSNSFLLRDDEGGMTPPELELRFAQDTLHVLFQFLRGNMDYGFRYQDGQLACTAFENVGVVVDRIDEMHMDLVRNLAVHRQGPVDQDTYTTEERIAIPPHPPLTLERLAMPMRTDLGAGLRL